MNVVLFCGGRGSASIIKELRKHWDINLTLLINGFDDGLSTGRLRHLVPGMLGPSDFRKNIASIAQTSSDRELLEMRMKTDKFLFLDDASRPRVYGWCMAFHDYRKTHPFDLTDTAFGNILFTGAYLANGNDFNVAVKSMADQFLSPYDPAIINVSDGRDRWLVALKSDGDALFSESEIVNEHYPSITELFLHSAPFTPACFYAFKSSERRKVMKALSHIPAINPEAEKAIHEANVIIYGPGTQHSSIYPSLMVAGKAIRANTQAPKIQVMNLRRDHDIKRMFVEDVYLRAAYYLGDPNNNAPSITHVLVDEPSLSVFGFFNNLSKSWSCNEIFTLGHFSDEKGTTHDGAAVLQEIRRIVG